MTLEHAPDYPQLRSDVAAALEEGRDQARKAVESARLQTYWTVGTRVRAYLDAIDRSYGDQTITRLAADVGIDQRLLYEIVEFRRRIEKVAPGPHLSWSHYRRLIRIGDSTVRNRYLEAAIAHGWSVRQLEAQISDGALADSLPDAESVAESEAAQLVAKRGEPWIYRLTERPDIGRVLDLGFRVFERLSEHDDAGLDAGALVRARRDEDGRYTIVPYEHRRRIYSYLASVASIIDADTLWVAIDCGFGTLCDQKVRLRGIDSPERQTPAGVRARDFVVGTLSSVDHVIVSTTKIDLYDRYLADIIYLPGESDPVTIARNGHYLNREIVAAGHGRRWTEEATEW